MSGVAEGRCTRQQQHDPTRVLVRVPMRVFPHPEEESIHASSAELQEMFLGAGRCDSPVRRPFPVPAFRASKGSAAADQVRDHADGRPNGLRYPSSFVPYAEPRNASRLLLQNSARRGRVVEQGRRLGGAIRAATSCEKTRLLVDAGAKVRVRTVDLGNTPLILAARRRWQLPDRQTAARPRQQRASAEHNVVGISPIMSGAASGDLDTVRLLLAAGANADDFPRSIDPRASDIAAGFRTPLMWAAYHNDVPMVLPPARPRRHDPNQPTYFGQPGIRRKHWNDGFEAAEVLIGRGAASTPGDAVAGFTRLALGGGRRSSSVPIWSSSCWEAAPDPNAAGGESSRRIRIGLPEPVGDRREAAGQRSSTALA